MRLEQITFTRFLAAISIVVFHYGQGMMPFSNSLISFIFEQANVGVSYFFILSGFVMIIAYGNKSKINTIDYLKNRFARIYPVYFLAILLTFVFFIVIGHPIDYLGLILNILTIQAWIPGQALSFNYPGWSLVVEFFFYALFPFLFNSIYKKRAYTSLVIPILLIWIISQVAFNVFISSGFYQPGPSESHDLAFYFPLMHLNEFLIGNLTGLFFINRLKEKTGNYDWQIMAIVFAIIIALKFPLGLNFHDGLLSLLFVPLILLISLNTGRLTSILNKPLFIFLGEISFGMYILQKPVFSWSYGIFDYFKIDAPTIIFYITVVLLIAASSISYILIETPLRTIIKNLGLPGRKHTNELSDVPNPVIEKSKERESAIILDNKTMVTSEA